jgi:hypothetical protein
MLLKLPGTRFPGAAAAAVPLLLTLSFAVLPPHPAFAAPAPAATEGGAARVQTMYTSWDDYYFYAAFRVRDANVLGTNTTTTSQPQQDDDIEVFFETDDARAKVRTPQTIQMAVSAAQGAYFSVGDGTKIPKGKAVYSYKYAVTVNGTLNKPDDTDTGYDVELAIPWSEMGRSGPPKPGDVWGLQRPVAGQGQRGYARRQVLLAVKERQKPRRCPEPVQVVPHRVCSRRGGNPVYSRQDHLRESGRPVPARQRHDCQR